MKKLVSIWCMLSFYALIIGSGYFIINKPTHILSFVIFLILVLPGAAIALVIQGKNSLKK